MAINILWNKGNQTAALMLVGRILQSETKTTVLLIMLKTLSFPLAFVEGRLCHRDNYSALAMLKGYGIYCHCVP